MPQAPPTLAEVRAALRAHEAELRRRGVQHAAVFGSVARGDARPDSDIDILVEIDGDKPVGAFEFAGIQVFLQDVLARSVDLATRGSHKPSIVPAASGRRSVSSDRLKEHLQDISEHIEAAQSFAASLTFQQFKADRRTHLAVVRALEIISEASGPYLRGRSFGKP